MIEVMPKRTHEICTMRVKFPSVVISGHINLGLVDETGDLDVCRRHE